MRLRDIRDDDYYTIKILGKPILGKYIKLPYIRKGIHEEILRRKEELEKERRFYLNIGDTPVLQFRTEPPAYIIHSNFQELRDILLELDMPEDPFHVYCSMLFRGSSIQLDKKRRSKEFQKYAAEIFGLFVRLPGSTSYDLSKQILHEISQYKCQPRYWSSPSGRIVQIWRLRLFSCSVTDIPTSISNPLSPSAPTMFYLEERWHPRRDLNLTLRGLEHISDSQISPFMEFTKNALHAFGKTRTVGRPSWSGRFKSPEIFLKAYKEAHSSLLLRTGEEPKDQAIANELHLGLDNLKKLKRKSGASRRLL